MVEARVQHLEVTMARMETHLEHIVDKIDNMVDSFKDVSTTINKNHEEVAVLKSQVAELKTDLNKLHEAKRMEKNKNVGLIALATSVVGVISYGIQYLLTL